MSEKKRKRECLASFFRSRYISYVTERNFFHFFRQPGAYDRRPEEYTYARRRRLSRQERGALFARLIPLQLLF